MNKMPEEDADTKHQRKLSEVQNKINNLAQEFKNKMNEALNTYSLQNQDRHKISRHINEIDSLQNKLENLEIQRIKWVKKNRRLRRANK